MSIDVLDPSDLVGHVPAGADLSSYQFRFVVAEKKASALKCVLAATAGSRSVLGVLQNKPTADGDAALVAVRGISKVICGSAVTMGNFVISSTAGEALTTGATGSHYIGRALADGTAGTYIPVELGYFGAT